MHLDILKIDNLWQMTVLTKLQLDNNLIEVIEGLDALVNLVWLGMNLDNILCIMVISCETLSSLKSDLSYQNY